MSSPYPVTGRQGTGVHPRYEIEELEKNHPQQFSLFILSYLVLQGRGDAFQEAIKAVIPNFQATIPPVPEAAQFKQVGGIHGLPFEEWLGDKRAALDSKGDYNAGDVKDTGPFPSRFGGYCNHGSVLFPHWHRPYVMLIEQAIGDIATNIAEQLMKATSTGRGDLWKTAAEELRFPFWDWADAKVSKVGMPRALSDDRIEITVANDLKTSAVNPLSFYPFEQKPDGFQDDPIGTKDGSFFKAWKRTLRYPNADPSADTSDIKTMNSKISGDADQIRRSTSDLFTFGSNANPQLTWDEFSNHTTQSLTKKDFTNIQSLESVHDSMHVLMGSNGHLGNPNYAGFDPIFYLHHCQIDRLLAFWEAVYPEYYFGDGVYTEPNGRTHRFTQATGSYGLVYNNALSGQTPLAPFRDGTQKYWTPSTVRFLDGKHYTYPPVAGVDLKDIGDLAQARKALQQHYGVDEPAKLSTGIKLETPTPDEGFHVVPNFRRIVLVVQAPEFAFNGSYTIVVHHEHEEEKILIGKTSVFARPESSENSGGGAGCAGCTVRRANGSTIRGIIPVPGDVFLSIAQEKAQHPNEIYGIDLIARRLKNGLTVTIINQEGTVVGGTPQKGALDELLVETDINITIVSSAARREGDDGPIEWFDFKSHKGL